MIMWNGAMELPVKEEKIEIKRGELKWPEDKMKFVKKWKQRYFVFCEIIKGSSRWLKLLYYKDKVAYTRTDLPMGYIDITVADAIKIMGCDMNGRKHIINISIPGKECYMSAPSCEEMYLWILALRAYKFNDESKFPWISQRSDSKSSSPMRTKAPDVDCPMGEGPAAIMEGIRPPLPTPDEKSPPLSPTYTSLPRKSDYALHMSNEKLRRKFLYCKNCLQRRDSYIAPEDYYPVMPTVKPPEIFGSPTTPRFLTLPASDARDDNIYDVISPSPYDLPRVSEPTENEYPSVNVIMSMSSRNRGGSSSSSSSATDSEEIERKEGGMTRSAKGINRENSPSFGSYVMMQSPGALASVEERKKKSQKITRSSTQESCPHPTRKLAKTLSAPYNVDIRPTIPTKQTAGSASNIYLSTVSEVNTQRNRDTCDSMSTVELQAYQELSLDYSSIAGNDSSRDQTVAIPSPSRELVQTPPCKPPRGQAQKPDHELTRDIPPTYVNRALQEGSPQGQSPTPFHKPSCGQPLSPSKEMKSHLISNLANEEDGNEIADGVHSAGQEWSTEEKLPVASGGPRVYVTDSSVFARKNDTLIERTVDEKEEGEDQGSNDHSSNIRLSRMFEKFEFVHIADV